MTIAKRVDLIAPPWKGLGGKRNHLPLLLPRLATSFVPECDRRIVEPFAGTAVVAANHPYRRAWLNDTNEAFANLLRWIIRDPDDLIDAAGEVWSTYGATEESYLLARRRYNDTYRTGAVSTSRSAAMTLFLNKHGFNGLFRLNRQGKFNVPYGKRHARIPQNEIMDYHRAFSLRETEVTCLDFADVVSGCGAGDVLYCDPPYVPASKTSSFIAYGNRWGEGNHRELNVLAAEAAQRGAVVLVSASDTPASRVAYNDARLALDVQVRRSVGASSESRKAVGELVFIY